MLFKQALKLLNAFGFGLKNKIVLLSGQGHQVLRAIVCSDTVQVVDNPALWHHFVMRLFPNDDVFKDISARSPGVFWIVNPNIPLRNESTPVPAVPSAISHQLNVTPSAPFRLVRTRGLAVKALTSEGANHVSYFTPGQHQVKTLGIVWGFLLGAFAAWIIGLL